MKKILSICIPTYNRAKYIDYALSSIFNQKLNRYTHNIEVCISDNASTDDTDKIVRYWKKKLKIDIIYGKNITNIGAGKNVMKVVSMASGEYCWILSSDDFVEKDTIKKVIEFLNKNSDIGILITGNNTYNFDLRKKMSDFKLYKQFKKNYKFKDARDFIKRDVTMILGSLSPIIFKKKNWDKIKTDKTVVNSRFPHLYMHLMSIKNNAKIYFLNELIVGYRLGNNSELERLDFYNGHEVIITSFCNITRKVFGQKSEEYRSIVNSLLKSHVNKYVIGGIKLATDRKTTWRIYALYFRWFKTRPKFWIQSVPFMFIPRIFYEIVAKTVYKENYQKNFRKN